MSPSFVKGWFESTVNVDREGARAGDCSSTVGQWLGRWRKGLNYVHWDEYPSLSSWLDGVGGITL